MSGTGVSKNQPQNLQGVIVLAGSFSKKHRMELLELVRTTECLAFLADPTLQIEHITEDGDDVVIETTTSSLAERIGERLCAVCGGTITKDLNQTGEARVRYTWSRDADGRS